MKNLAFATLVSFLCVASFGCGPKKTGTTTPPTAAAVTSSATKAPPASKPATTTSQTVEMACTAADVGKCGCLPVASWFTDGTNIFDVVCCEAAGNTIALYACGDTANCDASGDAIVCK